MDVRMKPHCVVPNSVVIIVLHFAIYPKQKMRSGADQDIRSSSKLLFIWKLGRDAYQMDWAE